MAIPTLKDYQRFCVEFIKARRASGLLLDMGLGKTLITLTALREMGQARQIRGNILIVAPVNIAKHTWPNEIKKWDHLKDTPYEVVSGLSKKERNELFDTISMDKPKIYIINNAIVQQTVEYFEKKKFNPFKTIIIDEAQNYKNPTSKRFKELIKFTNSADRVVILTGTPAPKNTLDLWSQIALLDSGRRLEKNITRFKKKYFDPGRTTPQGFPYEWHLKPGAEDFIYGRISDLVVSMKANDYLDMPELTFNTIEVALDHGAKIMYDELKKNLFTEIMLQISGKTDEKDLTREDRQKAIREITAQNAGVLTFKLLQLANGAIYEEAFDMMRDPDKQKKKREYIEVHDAKLDAVEQTIDSLNGEPALIFYWFNHDKERLLKRLKKLDIVVEAFDGTNEQLDRWNRGEIDAYLCQPNSVGYGLNLQDGGRHIIWFALPNFNLGLYKQSIARLWRQGQQNNVVIHHIVAKDTKDEDVMGAIWAKNKQQERFLDAVKAESKQLNIKNDPDAVSEGLDQLVNIPDVSDYTHPYDEEQFSDPSESYDSPTSLSKEYIQHDLDLFFDSLD